MGTPIAAFLEWILYQGLDLLKILQCIYLDAQRSHGGYNGINYHFFHLWVKMLRLTGHLSLYDQSFSGEHPHHVGEAHEFLCSIPVRLIFFVANYTSGR